MRNGARLASRAVLSLMLAAPIGASAESSLEALPTAAQPLLERIDAEQAANGSHSDALLPLLADLGHVYWESGREALATATFEQAREVLRANEGLSSLEEAPLIQALIEIEEGMGYVQEPWELEQALLELAETHPADVRSADIFTELGDRRMALLNRYLMGDFSPQLILGCYYHRSDSPIHEFAPRETNCAAGSRGALIRALTEEAWGYYAHAIRILNAHQLYSSAELHALETRLVRSAYERGAYAFGRRSLRRLLAYDAANDEPSLTRVDSLLEIADWDIVATHASKDRADYDSVLSVYEQAYAKLREEGVDASLLEARFAPDVPIVLPSFVPSPLVSRAAPDTTGFIDVAFEISKSGYGERVQVLGTAGNVSRAAEKELVRQIKRSAFRPRLVEGRIADAAPVVVRYFVAE